MIILVTGVTGLIGCHVALSLLRAGHRVVSLTRGHDGVAPDQRIRSILGKYPGFVEEIGSFGNLHVISGDIMSPCGGVDESDCEMLEGGVDAVVNCAGHVSFAPEAAPGLLAINVEGVRNMVDLAHRIGCARFIHVGTAYIDSLLGGGPARTVYEQSKLEGEKLLATATLAAGIRAVIVRPSIVTGDQRYGFTTTFNGIYPFMRFAALFHRELQKINLAALVQRAGFIRGAVNLIPADHVAAIIRALVENPARDSGVFNVINPVDWHIEELVRIGRNCFREEHDINIPVSARSPASASLPAVLEDNIGVLERIYEPYFKVALQLDSTSTEILMKNAALPILRNSPDWISALIRWGTLRNWEALA